MIHYSAEKRNVTGVQVMPCVKSSFTHQIAAEPNNAATGILTIKAMPLGLTSYQQIGTIDLTAPVALIVDGWFSQFEITPSVGTDDFDVVIGG